jgi:dolichol-phosphate mannosyltransferase
MRAIHEITEQSVSFVPSLLPAPAGQLELPAYRLRGIKDRADSLLLSLVIPTYNEGENIETLIDKIDTTLASVLPGDYEIIVVDDDSPDGTWEKALSLKSRYPNLRVMRRTEERGLSTAVIRGWQAARGEVFGVIDGDLQHPPEVLANLWQEVAAGADMAVASRHVEGGGVSNWSVLRRILSRGAQVLGLIVLPEVLGRVSDPMSGYFMVLRRAVAGVQLDPVGYKILIEVLARGRIGTIRESGYVFQERTHGESKVNRAQYFDYLRHIFRLRVSLLPIKRFARFALVGLSGVAVDMGLFYLLRGVFGLGLTRSAALSAEVAIINNFIWNELWTFGDIARGQGTNPQRLRRFMKFNLICLFGLLLNLAILNTLYNVFGINEYYAKVIAIAIVTSWNFWINLNLSWRVTKVA